MKVSYAGGTYAVLEAGTHYAGQFNPWLRLDDGDGGRCVPRGSCRVIRLDGSTGTYQETLVDCAKNFPHLVATKVHREEER